MDRQTIDQEGARTGEILAASMHLGAYTITLANIATMAVEEHSFQPYFTEKNRKTKAGWATFSGSALFFALGFLAWYGVMSNSGPQAWGLPLALGALSVAGFFVAGAIAVRYALKMKEVQPYYGLTIGVSDGSKVRLVDNNRQVLERIRDTILMKIETGDRKTVGRFDLNSDTLNLDAADETFA